MTNPQKIYQETVQALSREERHRLALLILNGLASSGASSMTAEDEIGRLYNEIARLSEVSASKPAIREQLRAVWRRLRELQSQEALAFRHAFEESVTAPLDAGRRLLSEARALRHQLEDLTAADPAT